MSRLYLHEQGRMLRGENEELTRWRWAAKHFVLPRAAVASPADLWLYLRAGDETGAPLAVYLNGGPIARMTPGPLLQGSFGWHRVTLPAGLLHAGENRIELRCEAPAMNAWMLGMEPTRTPPGSEISTDRGATWRRDHMGRHHMLQGEYLVRLRCHATRLKDRRPPRIIYEDTHHPRLRACRKLVPPRIANLRAPRQQVLALRSWVATRWSHRPFGEVYTPWDPWTILDWARTNRGEGQKGTMVMCVHFGVLFSALAAALGHSSRCIVSTEGIDTHHGHFMVEIWDHDLNQWVLHDPNFDLHYERDRPLSALEVAELAHKRKPLGDLAVRGRGSPSAPRRLLTFFNRVLATGRTFKLTGVWRSNAFVSRPELAPPCHGAERYTESDIVWYVPDGTDRASMFPYRTGDASWFRAAPGPQA